MMKLASTWCVLDPECVHSGLNELFFLKIYMKGTFHGTLTLMSMRDQIVKTIMISRCMTK